MRKGMTMLLALLMLFLPLPCTAKEDAEVTAADFRLSPYITIVSPRAGRSFSTSTTLSVSISGKNVQYIDVALALDGSEQTCQAVGSSLEHTFVFSPQSKGATLTVRGYADAEPKPGSPYDEQRVVILSPKEELIEKMIALAYANSKDTKYKLAPAEPGTALGVCKMFVMRLFDTYAKDYRMLAYPDLPLHMPVNKSKKASAPYDYGIEWKYETAAEGSPFEIVAQYKYDPSLTKEENTAVCRNVVRQIRKGDFFQMVADYGGGNGPHSMLMIADYDPDTDMLHWTDSNMRGTRIDGVRWGYLQWDADAPAEWFVECILKTSWQKRGCTVYRLRDDLFRYE